MKQQKGFTLIELIVVIAIIAILAAIVLINVTGYINKGKDSAAMADMETLLINATNFYSNSSASTFEGVLADPDYIEASNAVSHGGDYSVTASCDTDGGCADPAAAKWCASIPLLQYTPVQYFCVNSSGTKKQSTSEICSGGICPL